MKKCGRNGLIKHAINDSRACENKHLIRVLQSVLIDDLQIRQVSVKFVVKVSDQQKEILVSV